MQEYAAGNDRSMFSVEERDLIRRRLLRLAAQDPAVVTAAHATDDEDRWSDIDLAFATGALETTLVRSTDETEPRRALPAAATVLTTELTRTDPTLAERLQPILTELAATTRPGKGSDAEPRRP